MPAARSVPAAAALSNGVPAENGPAQTAMRAMAPPAGTVREQVL